MSNTSFLIAIQNDDETWFDFESFQKIDLRPRVRESLHDPTIHFAVTLFHSFLEQRIKDIVWNKLSSV